MPSHVDWRDFTGRRTVGAGAPSDDWWLEVRESISTPREKSWSPCLRARVAQRLTAKGSTPEFDPPSWGHYQRAKAARSRAVS